MKSYFLLIAGIIMFSGCVAKRHLIQAQNHITSLQADSTRFENKVVDLQSQISTQEKSIANLNKQINDLNSQNTALGAQSEEQINKLSQSQQELQRQQQRLKQLQDLLSQQKEASQNLKNKMTDALKGFSSNELTVQQKNGKVYVSLSENLLFPSGSAVINSKGIDALSKLAAVLNLNEDVAVNIEGHTDSIPIKGRYADNWDLSTARANSIVRILVNNYKVDPVRVTATGHSFYDPVDTNSTSQGRSNNRRTEIILSPKLEEMYQLLEKY